VAEVLSSIEEMKSQTYKNFARLIAAVQGTGPEVSMDDRRKFRYQAACIPARCAQYAAELFRISGGHAIYDGQPFGRYLNDLMAIQTHQLCNYQLNANARSGPLLGYAEAAKNYPARERLRPRIEELPRETCHDSTSAPRMTGDLPKAGSTDCCDGGRVDRYFNGLRGLGLIRGDGLAGLRFRRPTLAFPGSRHMRVSGSISRDAIAPLVGVVGADGGRRHVASPARHGQ
jgi:hypothetical protein